MLSLILIIIGISAVFFPFDPEIVERDKDEPTSLLSVLGGEGAVVVIRIIGGILVFIGILALSS